MALFCKKYQLDLTKTPQYLTIIGEFQAAVKYKHFIYNLPSLVMDCSGPNILGHNWFQALEVSIQDTSYAGVSNEAFQHTNINLPAVSHHDIGCNNGPSLHIHINPAVTPVYQ
ncbi:hypothetical protein PR048_023513 [Dryococelus australis]|uniref:Uncharacterized protein n=1 Tax=Dryococelus australis TaxID=614101 RepID=A0ABQ9GUC5_9NEOP|nr:hypothetical protein PR048_023513 [Dryococelus australis]